jgi:UPF0271 protein
MQDHLEPKYHVDLNCDLGESFGAYTLGMDRDILPYITSANVACGWHAGDPMVMFSTVRDVAAHKIKLGAHPGYPDLMGFGRRPMKLTTKEVKAYIIYQLGALEGFARIHGTTLHHVKPHGAMYNSAALDPVLAKAIVEAIRDYNPNLVLLGLAGSEMIRAAETAGIRAVNEVFADRAYQANGTLVPRTDPRSMIHDPRLAAERVVRMVKEGKVTAITGEDIQLKADSVCVHGDNPEALTMVRTLRQTIENAGITLKAF